MSPEKSSEHPPELLLRGPYVVVQDALLVLQFADDHVLGLHLGL